MPEKVVFERCRPAAAALLDQLPATRPAGHERRVSVELQPTPERRGLFRRPVPVPSASVSASFPDPGVYCPPALLVQVSDISGYPFGYGDALARDLSAKGVNTPDGWSLSWAFNCEVHWEVPFDEDPVRVIDHALTVLEALCEMPAQTFEAKVEHGGRYDGRTGLPEYIH